MNSDLYTLVADWSFAILCESFAFLYTGSSSLRQLVEDVEELDPAAHGISPKKKKIKRNSIKGNKNKQVFQMFQIYILFVFFMISAVLSTYSSFLTSVLIFTFSVLTVTIDESIGFSF